MEIRIVYLLPAFAGDASHRRAARSTMPPRLASAGAWMNSRDRIVPDWFIS
jgi:hypothetical protein